MLLGAIEILLIAIAIIGIIIILKDKGLTGTQRGLWVLGVVFFNFIALLSFFIWKSYRSSSLNKL